MEKRKDVVEREKRRRTCSSGASRRTKRRSKRDNKGALILIFSATCKVDKSSEIYPRKG